MFAIVRRQEHQFHQPGMHYQEYQHIDGAMPCVIKFLLLNRSRDGSADAMAFQDLEVRNLVDTDDPDALVRETCRIPIAPKDLLRSVLESLIQASRLPIASAMRLKINVAQNVSHRAGADLGNDSVGPGLPRQIPAGPMRDVQPFGHGLQTCQFNDLRPLHGGDLQIPPRVASPAIREQTGQARVSISLAGSPDGCLRTRQGRRQDDAPLPFRHSKHDVRTTNSKPRPHIAMGNTHQIRFVGNANEQPVWLTSTHGYLPSA